MNQYYILGSKISLTNSTNVLNLIQNYNFDKRNYICFCGLLEILQSYTDDEFQGALNKSFSNPLHSRLLEFYLNRKGIRDIEAVDTVELFKKLLNENLTHYFYGSTDTTLMKIKTKIECDYPNAKIIGYKSAPYVTLNEIKNNYTIKKDIECISSLNPDIVWIGIGGWKQDLLMQNYIEYLNRGLMIGVGAVFDMFAGNIKHSPRWIKRIGLRWLYFLIQQPLYRTSKYINLFISLIRTIIRKKILNQN